MNIAIFGATGHVARNLGAYWFGTGLYFFSRSPYFCHYDIFESEDYDVVINCIGMGSPEELEKSTIEIFQLTEEYDNKVLSYLKEHPQTLYINFSSGVVHDPIDINKVEHKNFYQAAKMYSEIKHRSLERNIVDLRLFSFFSRFIDLNRKFFMCEVINCIKQNKEFITDKKNMGRDYVHPKDLLSLIDKCITKKSLNAAFDVYSKEPTSKFAILKYFEDNHGLKVKFVDSIKNYGASLSRYYYPKSHGAEKIGYSPEFTSMDAIMEESKCLLF
jgi:nucleoside-diphosphate-sugar epimerase